MFQRYYTDTSEKASFTLTHWELFYAWIATKLKFFPAEESLASYFYISKAVGRCFLVVCHGLLNIAGGQLLAVGLLYPSLYHPKEIGREGRRHRKFKESLPTLCPPFAVSLVVGVPIPPHPSLHIQYNANAVCFPRICQSFLEGLLPFLLPSSFAVPCLCMLGSFCVKIRPLSTEYQALVSL